MAAKLLHSLADDNPDLQKQIGCMTGIFQIFDRQHFLSGRRLNQRRLLPSPPGNSKFSNGSLDTDSSTDYNREMLERNSNKYVNEKKRASTESSRASFSSSSRSSSFSSLDYGRTGQPEPPETPSRDPVISQTNASPKMGRLSVDLRDVVKDSMYRDSRGLSVQTTIKEEGSGHNFKHKDSPRPVQLSKSSDLSLGVGMKGKQDMPADIKESLRVLAKLHDAPWYYNEKELPRLSYESKEGSSYSISRDAPRFSYDGRDITRKIKDLPRLSLDSRESSLRSSIIDSKSTHLSGKPSSVVAKLMGIDMLPDTKPSDESQLGPIKTFPLGHHHASSVSVRLHDLFRPVRLPNSQRNSRKEPTSPRWKNPDGVMKPVSSSKFPIEPAPWKHVDSDRGSPKQASRPVKSSGSTSSTSPSVYGEIEKRLKDIEFKQSGKDLRALKQILETMQAKGLSEARKQGHSLRVANNRDDGRGFGSDIDDGAMNSIDSCTGRPIGSKLRGNGTSKASESSIVIMKPAKLIQTSGIPASSIVPINGLPNLQRPQSGEVAAHRKNSASSKMLRNQPSTADKKTNNRNLKLAETSLRAPQVAKDITTSLKNSGSISPRIQQKKLEFDKRSRPPAPPSDSNKARRQSNRQSTDSRSPGGRRRPKTSSVQQNDDQSSEKSNDSRNLSCQEDNVSWQSDANLTGESRKDIQPTSTEQPVEIFSCQSPSVEGFKCCISREASNDVSLRLSEEDRVGDVVNVPQQPSPVSVLDSSTYMEDTPSPVKQTPQALEGDAIAEMNDKPTEDRWNTVDILSTDSMVLELPSEMSRKKLQSIDNLVQKLRRLNSTHDEAQTDYIASLCENTNPDHRYVSEILLASGLLLRDLSSGLTTFQLHPSGHPINPELFFVLEQTKSSSLFAKVDDDAHDVSVTNSWMAQGSPNLVSRPCTNSKPEKFHRKLIFDAVNEILAQKLLSLGPPDEPWLKPEKLAKKSLNAQKLLRELCAEIEELQAKNPGFSLEEEEDGLRCILWEDVMHRSDNWTDFRAEFSGIVLDVERSIFKDLVNEIVIGNATNNRAQGKPNRRCRQLFSK